jgi:purine-nucleoside phosphorylase
MTMARNVSEAVEAITNRMDAAARIGIILGSGLGGLIEAMTDTASMRFEDIPGFPKPTVKGHNGEVVAGRLSGVPVIAISGRVHYYEGYTMQQVVFPVEVLFELGVDRLIITNASGAVNESYCPGDIVVIRDHINMMGDNPLRGTTRFTDLTECYAGELRNLAVETAGKQGIKLPQGVYLALSGPCYETPAEIRMFRGLGADLVGMSTVPEVIRAKGTGMRVLGLSMVANMAAGITGKPLSHQEVIEMSRNSTEKFKRVIVGVVEGIGERDR